MNNREAFEAWYQNEYVQFGRANFHFNSYGEYFDDDIEASWCAWQAALASQAAELSSNPLQLPAQAQQTESKLAFYVDAATLRGMMLSYNTGNGYISWRTGDSVNESDVALYVIPPAPEGDKE